MVTTLSVSGGGEDRVKNRVLGELDGVGEDSLAPYVGDAFVYVLGHDVAHLHRSEERQQMAAGYPRSLQIGRAQGLAGDWVLRTQRDRYAQAAVSWARPMVSAMWRR